MFKIEIVFVLFPVLCLFFSLCKNSNSKITFFSVSVLYLLAYVFSLNGADFNSYKNMFESVTQGATAQNVYGEIGYYYIMKLATVFGLDYMQFRILYLGSLSIIFFVLYNKITSNLPLSIFILTSMFIIYLISAYRQLIVIVFSLFWFIEYSKGRKIISVIGTAALLVFHKTAILPFVCLSFLFIVGDKKQREEVSFFCKNYIGIVFIALIIRLCMMIVIDTEFFHAFMSKFTNYSYSPVYITPGFVSRLSMIILVSFCYSLSNNKNVTIMLLFWYYFTSMFVYICIPMEFIMGRLLNNASIFMPAFLPSLVYRKEDLSDTRKLVSNDSFLALAFTLIIAFVILIHHLSIQIGYTPYRNILIKSSLLNY